MDGERDILAVKGHCKIQYSICTEKYGSDRIDGAKTIMCKYKGVGVSPIPFGDRILGIKMLSHIQNKCDSTLMWLIRGVVFHDIPIKGSVLCP